MKFILIIIATALVTFIEADRPVFFLKCSDGEDNRARNVCNNQCYATNCLPRYQNRDRIYSFNKDKTTENRKSSGCSANPCGKTSKYSINGAGPGQQCDEFPQASWNEGGSGSSLRCVPERENRSQGGQFKNFVQDHNLQKDDEFEINWLWNGSEEELDFCLNENYCENDSFQFYYDNGQFNTFGESLSDLGDGYHLTNGTYTSFKPQVFKTDTGMVLVNPNRNGIVNTTIYTYNEDGTKETHVPVEHIQ